MISLITVQRIILFDINHLFADRELATNMFKELFQNTEIDNVI